MIHKSCIIDKSAKISKNVKIGPYSIIGQNVEIEEEVVIYSHVNITGNTKVGKGTKIFPFASIGTMPQDLKFKGEKNKLIIGKNNTIREYVTINPGTEGGGGITSFKTPVIPPTIAKRPTLVNCCTAELPPIITESSIIACPPKGTLFAMTT